MRSRRSSASSLSSTAAQPPRVGLDPLGVVAQLGADVGELDREGGEALADRVEPRVDPGDRLQPRLRLAQRAGGPAAVLVGPGGRPRARAPAASRSALGVAQPLALAGQLRLLGRVGGDLLDLGELVAVEVEVALPRAVALAQLGQLRREPPALAVRLAVALAPLQLRLAGEAVEHVHLRRGDRQPAVLVLAVEGEQPAAEQLQVGRGGGAPGDERRRPPRGRDPAPEHDLLGALRQPPGELRQLRIVEQPGRQVEGALDPGLAGARADDLRARLAAHQQVEGVGEHGLAGAGLAGDRVEPLPQAQLGALDQEQVLDPQLAQHAPCVATAADRLSLDRVVAMGTRVLILGAGFGGLELATTLSEELGDDVEVTLIDKGDAFVFGYSKLDVMFGRRDAEAVRLPYRDFAKPGVRLLQRDGHRDRPRGARG